MGSFVVHVSCSITFFCLSIWYIRRFIQVLSEYCLGGYIFLRKFCSIFIENVIPGFSLSSAFPLLGFFLWAYYLFSLSIDFKFLWTTCLSVLPSLTCTFGAAAWCKFSQIIFGFVILFSQVNFPVNFSKYFVYSNRRWMK